MIRTGTVAFLSGIVLLQQMPQLPPVWFLITITVLLSPLLICSSLWLRAGFFIVAGFVWASSAGYWQLNKQLPSDLIRKDIQVIGYVASLPEESERRIQFDFDITGTITPNIHLPNQKIRLSWYQYQGGEIKAGDKWQFTIRLKPARNFFNPSSFDYSAWLLQKGILSSGYVRKSDGNQLISSIKTDYPIQRFRQTIRQLLVRHLGSQDMEPVLRGLMIGDRSGMDSENWQILRDTGTIHLLAISGLHIGLVAGLGFMLFRRIWSLSTRCCHKLAAPRAAAVFSWIVALIYAGLAGFSLPTQRAMVMLSVILLSILVQRQYRSTTVLCIALLLILLLDPFAVLSIGFWLSFLAVALIYYLLMSARPRQMRLLGWLRVQILISIYMMPLLIYFFQQAPGLSPLANIIAVPFVSIVIVPFALIGVLVMFADLNTGILLLELVIKLLDGLWFLLNWLSEIKFSVFSISASGLLPVLLAMTGLFALFLPRGFPSRWPGLVLCLPLIFPNNIRPEDGRLFLSVLDVGQGLAAVIQTRNHTLVFDAGPRYSQKLDAAEATIIPFLISKGIRQIDTLIISHGDNDHIGGARTLLQKNKISDLYTSVAGKLSDYNAMRCQAGISWEWDGVIFKFLHPASEDYLSDYSENNLSCVLQIITQDQRILLTGDIEKQAEAQISARYAGQLKSHILVAPHHGSNTSSTKAFLDSVKPQIVIVPVGWLNRFRLPNMNVIRRFQAMNARILSTSESGAILLTTGEILQIERYRYLAKRYWHYQDPVIDTSSYGRSLLKLAAD